MDTCILKLHPENESAKHVVQDSRNQPVLLQDGDLSTLAFHVDRPGNICFGRNESCDVVLTHPKCSAEHGFISVNDDGIPTFHDRSSNGTKIAEKLCHRTPVKLEHGMIITIVDASFKIEIPQRGFHQQQYERNAMRTTMARAQHALEALPLTSGSTNTVLSEVVGPYKTTSTLLDPLRKGVRREVATKDSSLFVLKRFDVEGLAPRERRAWKVIQRSNRQHPNIDMPVEIFFKSSPIVVVTHFRPLGNVREYYTSETHIPSKVAASIMAQLLEGLKFLHELGIVHCSVQLENLNIASKEPLRIELTGLEISALEGEELFMVAGSPPELWERSYRRRLGGTIWEDLVTAQGYSEKWPRPFCGKPVDIWSAGTVCSELTLGKRPCYVDESRPLSGDDEEAAKYIKLMIARLGNIAESPEAWRQKLNLPLKSTSPVLLNFLKKLLDLDPTSRANVEDCLADPWLTTEDHGSQVKNLTRKRRILTENATHKRSKLNM